MKSDTKEIEQIYSSGKEGKQIVLRGIPSSPGIVIGKARVIKTDNLILPEDNYSKILPEEEIERFKKAVSDIDLEYEDILLKVKNEGHNVKTILESISLIIKDPMINESIIALIRKGYNAESAVTQEYDKQKQYFRFSTDDLLKERAVDLDHIKKRILSMLRYQCFIYEIAKDAIVVAQSITPTDLVNYKEAGVLALITEIGGLASHTSILARNFEIPEVIGIKDATNLIKYNDTVIVDGYSGNIVINPQKSAIAKYIERRKEFEKHREKLGEIASLPSQTIDGREIIIRANIDSIKELHSACMAGANGAGLVRSESLILKLNAFPNEQQQYEWYQDLADSAYPNPVTIRAFDIGSDKFSEGIPHHEDNPALGLRGIRYLLSRKDLLKSQIRAVLMASKNKNVKFMIPMISTVYEVIKCKEIFDECKQELIQKKITFDKHIPFGIMIETPAAALISDQLAKLVDFFSIGTNDLTQYTIGADRNNDLVNDIFDSFHPAVISLIKITADSAIKNKIDISVCGELASHSAATNILIGLGIKELSVAPSSVLELKNRIREINYSKNNEIIMDTTVAGDFTNLQNKFITLN